MADNSKYVYLALFALFALLTFRDLFGHTDYYNAEEDVQNSEPAKEIPIPKVGLGGPGIPFAGPVIKFQYCFSCGYQKAYQEYSNILKQKYPEIQIVGENYQPPSYNMILAKLFGALKMIIIIAVLSGANILALAGLPPPIWWVWCQQNKLYACMMVFFVCNALESHLVSTGAFEISFNDVPIWSKLETGRIPQPPELFQILDSHLQFSNHIDFESGIPGVVTATKFQSNA